jgi:aryl-alcohol dehydrogenase-like predicted oxidoreductase
MHINSHGEPYLTLFFNHGGINSMAGKKIPERTLGKSKIPVTELGIGLWAIGGDSWGPTDDRDSLSTIDAALEAGVTFFDTADVYGAGHSEELLGKAMRGRRDKFIVATKIGWQDFNSEQDQTAYTSVDKLVDGVESNLRRLQTDYIDLMQSHISYREPTMEVFLEGFQKLQQEGKLRAYGVSTSDLDYLKAFNKDGSCSSLQIDYSILNRTPEAEIFPYCRENDIGVIVRGPLAMGILTGKFHLDTVFHENDWRKRWQENEDERKIFENDLKCVQKLKTLFPERDLARLALQFVLSNPAVTTVIPGAKNVQQLHNNLAAAGDPLSDPEMELISQVIPPGGGRKIWPA